MNRYGVVGGINQALTMPTSIGTALSQHPLLNTPKNLRNMAHPLNDWRQQLPTWANLLQTNIHDLVQPGTAIATQYPHLHEAFAGRLDQAWIARNDAPVSRCDELILMPDGRWERADADQFQIYHNHDNVVAMNHQQRDTCQVLEGRMHVYAKIGGGSYGEVFLARQPVGQQDSDGRTRYQFYAVKVEPHWDMACQFYIREKPTMTVLDESTGQRYIPHEALLLMLGSNNDRFPKLDSVYVDDKVHSIVMEACMDPDLLRVEPKEIEGDELQDRRVVSFTGMYLTHKKKPLLNEEEVCKVASQILEGFAYLRHMNVSYGDLSKANYIIDESLNTKLIDLGMTTFGFTDLDFQADSWAHVVGQENILTPEIALELSKPDLKDQDRHRIQVDIPIPHDTRIAHLWRIGALTYEMLHGYAPWESPDWEPALGKVDESRSTDAHWKEVYERRDRIINEELPVREDLSQDCVDMLRMMLHKQPMERATLEELCSVPWFGQWAYQDDMVWVRPESEPYDKKRRNESLPPWRRTF